MRLGYGAIREVTDETLQFAAQMGAIGVPVLGYNFMPLGVWRTSRHTPGRGGASVTCFNMERAKDAPLFAGTFFPGIDFSDVSEERHRAIDDDEMWANFEYFIKAVIPVAEEAGVKMALHPDDGAIADVPMQWVT
jgi:mannonate dehydratase